MDYKKSIEIIRKELKAYIQKNNIESLIIGISGGMDSCLCAALAHPVCEELGIPLIGRSLPCSTNKSDELERARLTGQAFCTNFVEERQAFCTNFVEESIENWYKMISDKINPDPGFDTNSMHIRNGNIKARIRMIYLYDLASKYHGMVLSTANKTEFMLGFWTLHGDVGDFGMIQEMWKSEVYDMAEWLLYNELEFSDQQTAMELTINALATDGLGVTNKGDLGQIMPEWEGNSRDGYKEVDKILMEFESMDHIGFAKRLEIFKKYENDQVIKRHLRTEFKRNNPVNIQRNLIIDINTK